MITLPTPAKPPSPALIQLVTQLGRALKATRFYEPSHAIVVNLLAEAHKALSTLLEAGPFTLGAVGTTLLSADGPLEVTAVREVAGSLAGMLYQRSVAALRFEKGVTAAELTALISAIAPSPDEVRARGGVLGQLAISGITSIRAVEVDLKALHGGEQTRLDELAGDDPVALQAVKRALQLEKGKKAAGEALLVALAPEAGAAELGQYLDRLVRRASASAGSPAPGSAAQGSRPGQARGQVASAGLLRGSAAWLQRPGAGAHGPGHGALGPGHGAAGGQGAAGEGDGAAALTADQLAQLATSAFEQVLKGPRGATPQDSQAALQQLGHALGKLGADVRFKVLQRLARADADGARPLTSGPPPVAGLASLLSDQAVAELITAGLADQGDPEELAQLLTQLRPDGAARQAALAQVATGAGPSAAKLLEKLQESVLSGGALADRYVPVPFRESLRQLQAAAQLARTRAGEQEGLPALLADAEPLACARFAAAAWVKLSREPDGLAQVDGAAQELIEWLEDNHDFASAVKLAFAVAEACERARPPRRELIHKLFSGAAGVARAERLLVEGAPPRPWISTALEPLVFHGAKTSVRPKLVAALSAQGEAILPRLRARFADASPAALSLALEIACAVSTAKTLPLCRELLRSPSREAKAIAVRTLARLASEPAALALLASLSGAEGDKPAAAALKLEGITNPVELRNLQREAVLALGQSRSSAAAAPLGLALHRSALFGDKELEPIRLAAAAALGDLLAAGVSAARGELERGARDAKGRARELCARTLERRP